MANLIKLRRDTKNAWTNVDPVLSQGEPGFEIDTNNIKIGNGFKKWSELPYFKTENLPPNSKGYLTNNGTGTLTWYDPPIPFSGSYTDLINKPVLHPVATSGNYNSLNNKPTIPTDLSNLTDTTNLLTGIQQFNNLVSNLQEFDFGPITYRSTTNLLDWFLLNIDVDCGTFINPANLSHDAGTFI